jgi:peptide/nickel transport system substrate-binding protein
MRNHDHRSGAVARLVRAVACFTVGALVLAACSSSTSPSSSSGSSPSSSRPQKGGTVVYAHEVGDTFSWIFPLPNQTNYEAWDFNTYYGMWRPLYFAGPDTGGPGINNKLSLAYPPVWSNNDTTITIRLRNYKWSDGVPVTTADVKFFFELYDANKSAIGTYIAGDMPDNVRSIDYVSPTEFVMHLTHSFSPQWYEGNELTIIDPLPAQVWDVESLNGKVGNYAATRSGAKKVFAFLAAQAKELTTYQTNPLWKVVDGPWVISQYNPTTARTVVVPNTHYSGPDRPHLASVVYETFASDTAEIDALRSGELSFGFLPYSDLGLTGYFKSHGYSVVPWRTMYFQSGEFGYTSPTYGPLVRQLYIRQALQHLINEPLYLRATLHGYGQLTYGPVPNLPGSPYVSSAERIDPYPYSTSAARDLLAAHGWATKSGSGGTMVCERPGTGSGECGAGIAAGRPLDILLMYTTGYPTLSAQVQAFVTAASGAGIHLALDPQSESTMFSIAGVCPPGPCNYGIVLYSVYFWDFGQDDSYPTGGQIYGTGNYWGGGYVSSQANRLIALTHTTAGLQPLYNYENYISRQVAALWLPTWDDRIAVIKKNVGGALPLDVYGNPRPSRWYLTSSS